MQSKTYRRVNLALFAGAQCFAMLGAAHDWPMAGPLVVAVWLAGSSFFMIDAPRQLGLIAAVGIVGSLLESLLIAQGVYLPSANTATTVGRLGWLCPLWITSLWVGCGLALNGSLAWLQSQRLLAARLGAVAAPAIYGLAHYLGAIRIMIPPLHALGCFAAAGAAMLPLGLFLARSRAYRIGNGPRETPAGGETAR